MINGLFLDPRAWNMDIRANQHWAPEKYGVKIDLHDNAFNIPKVGIDKKYKFVIVTEVWEEPMRDVLQYLRNRGLKVYFLPRETMTLNPDALLNYDVHMYKGERFFCPDVVLAPNIIYHDIWKQKAKSNLTGHPRFDNYVGMKLNKQKIMEKYNLDKNKTIMFFPSYQPTYYQKNDKGEDAFVNVFDEREQTMEALEEFAIKSNVQVVVKIHPTSFKNYKKNREAKDVVGLTKKYYKNPTDYFKVMGDERMSSDIARELLYVSDVVVGCTSTMLLEASLLSKPILHISIGEWNNYIEGPKYGKVFDTVYVKEEIVERLDKISSDLAVNYSQDDISQFTYHVDGKCCKRICEVINKEQGSK